VRVSNREKDAFICGGQIGHESNPRNGNGSTFCDSMNGPLSMGMNAKPPEFTQLNAIERKERYSMRG
jgi:hypothetical protein